MLNEPPLLWFSTRQWALVDVFTKIIRQANHDFFSSFAMHRYVPLCLENHYLTSAVAAGSQVFNTTWF